jgi:hypothetical protein
MINSSYPNIQSAEQPKVCISPYPTRASSSHSHNHHLSILSNCRQYRNRHQPISKDRLSKLRSYFRPNPYPQLQVLSRDWGILVQLDRLSSLISPRLRAIPLYIFSYPSGGDRNLAPKGFITLHIHSSHSFISLVFSIHSAHFWSFVKY